MSRLKSLLSMPIWAWAASIAGAVILLSSLTFVVLYSIYTPSIAPGTEIWNLNRSRSVTFMDPEGKIFARRGAAHGDRVSVKEMPPFLPAAFLAVEDRRFYDHWGVDLRGVARAFWSNLEAGDVVAGGSTITQQLAKNVFLSHERTLGRKFEELFVAIWLERHYSKDDILTYYLNRIYLGSGTYGVDAAARQYFGKSARDVTLAEAAMIAALTRAPSVYSPEADYEKAKKRAELVLDLLVQEGVITAADAKKAKAKPAKLVINQDLDSEGYYADFALDQLQQLEAAGNIVLPKNIDVTVRTTINRKLQREAQRAVTTILRKEGPKRKVTQGALVAMEPDGMVRALVGGRSYNESSYNRAFQAQRQPGSSFKPIVFLAALQRGMTPDTIRDDAPYEDRGWTPANYDNRYRGPVSLREALALSLNTVAVRVADEVGRNAIITMATRLGVTSKLEPNRSLPLGTSEVSVLEMTGVYSAFANGGYAVKAYCIIDVTTADGKQVYVRSENPRTQAMSTRQDADMNQMLYEVVQTGTGRAADLGDRPAAAKTGTTQNYRDAWFIGYTADYVTGVWVGNDDNTPTKRVAGGGLPASIWKAFMTAAHRGLPIRTLPGIDLYSEPDPGYYTEAPPPEPEYAPPPQRPPPEPDQPGLIDRFLDDLFGGSDYPDEAPPPPPRDGPYRQPEPEVEASVDPDTPPQPEPEPMPQPEAAPVEALPVPLPPPPPPPPEGGPDTGLY
jgi:penicillin-binding protein 1A